jgi:hypothetical protein
VDDAHDRPVGSGPLATAALRALAAIDLDTFTGDELTEAVLDLQKVRGALDVAEARVLSRWDAQGEWRPSGARSGAAWLAWKQRLPIGVARQRIRHARAMRDLPAVEEAWRNGEIDRAHVTTLLGVRTARTRAAFEHDHERLLDAARSTWFVNFKAQCDRWEMLVDADGAEQDAGDDLAAREVHLSRSFQGMWFGRMTMDPLSGEIVHATLEMIERELFEAEWATAKERLGREPTVLDLGRTPAQRRADALVEMATRARTEPKGGRRPAPLFNVLVGYETFAGPLLELFNRQVLTPGTVAPWLTEADIERIVFGGPSRVIDVGATRRFFRGALRRAIEIRDRRCFHPSCTEPPDRQQIDHIQAACQGGETTQENGRAGCAFHNRWRLRHPDSEWDQGEADTGDPEAGPDPPLT